MSSAILPRTRSPTESARARTEGANPRLVVVTLPDNPTGPARPDEVKACRVAEAEDLVVVSDEIYRDVVFGSVPFVSPADLVPDRTVTVTGLSKSLALGGWRVGAIRFPGTEWGRALRGRVVGFASQVWSNLAAPMESVAEYAFDEPADLVRHREASTRLHGAVANAVHDVFARDGVLDVPPDGAFYVYPDFEPHRQRLEAHGIRGGSDLARWLLEEHGLAVLAEEFGDDPHGLRFRAATSLLYGATPELAHAGPHRGRPAAGSARGRGPGAARHRRRLHRLGVSRRPAWQRGPRLRCTV